jgi:hypothetical protein
MGTVTGGIIEMQLQMERERERREKTRRCRDVELE